jgi:hypothetical protein
MNHLQAERCSSVRRPARSRTMAANSPISCIWWAQLRIRAETECSNSDAPGVGRRRVTLGREVARAPRPNLRKWLNINVLFGDLLGSRQQKDGARPPKARYRPSRSHPERPRGGLGSGQTEGKDKGAPGHAKSEIRRPRPESTATSAEQQAACSGHFRISDFFRGSGFGLRTSRQQAMLSLQPTGLESSPKG